MLIIYAVAAFAVTFAVIVLIHMLTNMPVTASSRLRTISPTQPAQQANAATGIRDSTPTITRLITGKTIANVLSEELSSAGLPMRPGEFLVIMLASTAVFLLIPAIYIHNIVGYAVFAFTGAMIPVMIVKLLQDRRRRAFNNQLVDALIMMASSLRSGFSFLRAMQMVSNEMPQPISSEFERIVNQINVGKSMDDALRESVVRIDSYDYELVVTAVSIQQQVGGNLADILDTIARTIRERVRMMGEIKALTAEGRISGIVLVILPIGMGLIIWFLNPTYIGVLFQETLGHYLIGIAIGLQILGAIVIRKLLSLDI